MLFLTKKMLVPPPMALITMDIWYITSCEGENGDGTYKKDHLMRVEAGSNLKWKHPPKCDWLKFHPVYIFDCKIDGEWDVSNERYLFFN